MEVKLTLFGIILSSMMVGLILFVIFGQKTVRKLRKNPATKGALGIQFIHGWDIGNVMMALALPEKITRLRKGSSLAALTADSELLKKHTTPFDQILAKILCATMTSSVLSMFAFMLAESLGIFE
jgi:hypothetical protein